MPQHGHLLRGGAGLLRRNAQLGNHILGTFDHIGNGDAHAVAIVTGSHIGDGDITIGKGLALSQWGLVAVKIVIKRRPYPNGRTTRLNRGIHGVDQGSFFNKLLVNAAGASAFNHQSRPLA